MNEITILPHDPNWKIAFDAEARLLSAALGKNVVAIHHIGSTSIPGIYAKPVIDILVELRDVADADNRTPEMEALGYEVMGEFGITGRRYFRKDDPSGVRTHQIHAFQAGTDQVIRHLAFRDCLIAHPDEALAYSNLKRKLAARHPNDMDSYIDGKDAFIKDIDRRAAE